MPFYEYECSGCKYYTEVLQKLSDPVLRKCPSCGKNTFKKLVSAPVFRLKGSGWYETDFKGDKDNKRNLAGDESKPADDKATADKDGKAAANGDKAGGDKPGSDARGGDGSGGDKAGGDKGSRDKAGADQKDTAKAGSAKAPAKPAASSKPAARSRRGAPAPRAKAAPAKASRKR